MTRRLPDALRWVLIFEGVAMLAAGVLLLMAPGTADDVWPWALSRRSPRARSARFCFGVGLAALIAVRDDDPLSFRGAALAYTVLGLLELLALNLHIPDLGDRPARHGALRGVLGRWSSLTGGLRVERGEGLVAVVERVDADPAPVGDGPEVRVAGVDVAAEPRPVASRWISTSTRSPSSRTSSTVWWKRSQEARNSVRNARIASRPR